MSSLGGSTKGPANVKNQKPAKSRANRVTKSQKETTPTLVIRLRPKASLPPIAPRPPRQEPSPSAAAAQYSLLLQQGFIPVPSPQQQRGDFYQGPPAYGQQYHHQPAQYQQLEPFFHQLSLADGQQYQHQQSQQQQPSLQAFVADGQQYQPLFQDPFADSALSTPIFPGSGNTISGYGIIMADQGNNTANQNKDMADQNNDTINQSNNEAPLNTPKCDLDGMSFDQKDDNMKSDQDAGLHNPNSNAFNTGFQAGSYNDAISPTSSYPQAGPLTGNDARPSRVAIPHQNSTASSIPSPGSAGENIAMAVTATGPMSKSVNMVARPKPGRKPMGLEDQQDRRRLQNRMAQRSFRDKRQQKLADTMTELAALKTEYEKNVNRMEYELAAQRTEYEKRFEELKREKTQAVDGLQQQLRSANEEIDNLKKQLQGYRQPSLGGFRPAAGHGPVTSSSYSMNTPTVELEIDYTNYGKSTAMDYVMVDRNTDPCGFCTDEQNCACRNTAAKPEPMEPPISGAGSCADCLKDPARAQACREMANKVNMANASTPGSSGAVQLPRRSCSSLIDDFNKFGSRTASITSLFGRQQVNAYPSSQGAGFDMEEKQVAEVLSNLRRDSEAELKRKDSNR